MISFRPLTGQRAVSAISFRDASNVVRAVGLGQARNVSNALKTFFSGLSAIASPDAQTGYGAANAPIGVGVGPFTASVSGGVSPFTFAWSGPVGWTFSDASAQTVTAFSPDLNAYEGADAALSCEVTDSAGAAATSNFVYAYAYNLGGGGGAPIP